VKHFIKYYFIALFLFISCNRDTGYLEIQGPTMGSDYIIKYKGNMDLTSEVDSILEAFSFQFSTYDPNSVIYLFNNNDSLGLQAIYPGKQSCEWWKSLMDYAQDAYTISSGAFDPSLGPLLSYWGFGDQVSNPESIDSSVIDSLKRLTGFHKFTQSECLPLKHHPDAKLNFNALAAGYATDIIADWLQSKGIVDYLINITGEIKCKGKNPWGKSWSTQVEKPIDNSKMNPPMITILMQDEAMATSGNYRNYFKSEGKKFAHSIHPNTGFPALNNMLSATVLTQSGALADALATAFMVSGVEKSREIVLTNSHIEAMLVWEENKQMKIWMSDGFKKRMK
jgi:FAD:protein FMN transferase